MVIIIIPFTNTQSACNSRTNLNKDKNTSVSQEMETNQTKNLNPQWAPLTHTHTHLPAPRHHLHPNRSNLQALKKFSEWNPGSTNKCDENASLFCSTRSNRAADQKNFWRHSRLQETRHPVPRVWKNWRSHLLLPNWETIVAAVQTL